MVKFADRLFVLIEGLLELEVEFLGNKSNKLNLLKFFFVDALVAHHLFGLLDVTNVNFSVLSASFFVCNHSLLCLLSLLLASKLLLLVHLLHHTIVLLLAMVTFLAVSAHAAERRVLIVLVAECLDFLSKERLLVLRFVLVEVH